MNKTKMIATIGPASKSKEITKKIIECGIDVVRINMSHASFEDAREIINNVRDINNEENLAIGIMIDTRGPEIRINELVEKKIKLETGNTIRITKNMIKGNQEMISITLPQALDYVRIGQKVLMNDGNVVTEVMSKTSDMLICEIKNDGYIKSNCSINIPDADFNIRFLSEFDKETIKFAVDMKADYIALSHVKSDLDVLDVNDLLIDYNDDKIQIISKIENKEAIDEIESILKVSDGVMISRGDLGIEMQLEKIPSIQKKIANLAKEKEKICIIANEMLSSMQESPRPTRAEVSDVANAVIDGTDAIMLSSETAIGRYPVETVQTANKIIDEIEEAIDYNNLLLEFNRNKEQSPEDAICFSAVDCANRVNAKAIICSTLTGKTAKKISYYRPSSSVVAISPDERTVTGLSINYGIIPVKVPMLDTTEEILNVSVNEAKKVINLSENDKVVITGSFNSKTDKITNFVKIDEIKGE